MKEKNPDFKKKDFKYSNEDVKWHEKLVERFQKEFPESNFRKDEEYFVYDMVSSEAEPVTGQSPKWDHVPIMLSDDKMVRIKTEDVIRAELRHRHKFPTYAYTVSDSLREEGTIKTEKE